MGKGYYLNLRTNPLAQAAYLGLGAVTGALFVGAVGAPGAGFAGAVTGGGD
ncbi:MAG: hypothetical protein WCG81_18185 [Candidatus Angelobacter sp.]